MTAPADTDEPSVDAQAASLVESGRSVFVLAGTLVKEANTGVVRLLTSDHQTKPLDDNLAAVLGWFNTARTDSQVGQWFEWAEAPAGLLDDLVRNRLVAKVNAVDAWRAAKSLKGFRLQPTSYLDPDSEVLDGLVALKRTPESRNDTSIPAELAEILFGAPRSFDVPTAITALAKRLGAKREVVARFVLTEVPFAIDYGYLRLEPLRG